MLRRNGSISRSFARRTPARRGRRSRGRHGIHVVTEKPMAIRLDDACAWRPRGRRGSRWRSTGRSPGCRRFGAEGTGRRRRSVKCGNSSGATAASLGPLAHGSPHPGDTVISGVVSDAEKGWNGGIRRRWAAALCSITVATAPASQPGYSRACRFPSSAWRRI